MTVDCGGALRLHRSVSTRDDDSEHSSCMEHTMNNTRHTTVLRRSLDSQLGARSHAQRTVMNKRYRHGQNHWKMHLFGMEESTPVHNGSRPTHAPYAGGLSDGPSHRSSSGGVALFARNCCLGGSILISCFSFGNPFEPSTKLEEGLGSG